MGAALALKEVMAAQQIPGKIRLYGCAAEETEGAKVYMAREGLFRDLAAALHWHPSPLARVSNYRSTAVDQLQIEFFGKSSHAASAPWLGRSAVHAAELFAHGLNLMREHVEPTARIHYVYEQAARADFDRRVSAHPYVSPLPPEMQRPLGLPDWLNEDTLLVG